MNELGHGENIIRDPFQVYKLDIIEILVARTGVTLSDEVPCNSPIFY